MSKIDGINNAIKLAMTKLGEVDLNASAELLGLPVIDNHHIVLRMFGQNLSFSLDEMELTAADGKPVKPGDHLLLLHYLLCTVPLKATGQLISYRDFTGGQFYYKPFLSRTADPLLQRFGNNLDDLIKNLARFDWQQLPGSDFMAQVHTLGDLKITLIYRLGDSEFPPDCEVLFDAIFKRVFCAEDAAYAASRICLGLM